MFTPQLQHLQRLPAATWLARWCKHTNHPRTPPLEKPPEFCMCAYVHIYAYTCGVLIVYVRIHSDVCIHTDYIYIYIYIYMRMCVHMHMRKLLQNWSTYTFMLTSIYTFMLTCIYTFMLTCIYTFMLTCIYTFMLTCIYTLMLTCIYTFMFTRANFCRLDQMFRLSEVYAYAHRFLCTHTHYPCSLDIHTYIHTKNTHTYIHTCIHTYIHTYYRCSLVRVSGY